MGYLLTKSFMNKHGVKKKSMKVNWHTYITLLNEAENRAEQKRKEKKVEEER